jgi:hypothetical protein
MARETARTSTREARLAGLGRLRRRELTDVRRPGDPTVRIDRVLIGPSGVHVITVTPGRRAWSPAPEEVADAGVSATSISALLPARYRSRVRAVLCPTVDEELGEWVGEVLIASPVTLEHVLRSLSPSLSTSEVSEIANRLEALLDPYPTRDATPPRRLLRGRLALVVALLGGGAVVAAGLVTGAGERLSGLLPW